MDRFYVYQYVREDGSPFYIGKGTRYRAWTKHTHTVFPKSRDQIQIVKEGLTHEQALELEETLIAKYGRKSDGGILVNIDKGGQGRSGFTTSEETKEKQRQVKLGTTRSKESKERQRDSAKKFWETYDSTERDAKISAKLKGRVIGCRKKKSIAAKKRYRAPVSCLRCSKEGKMPTMVGHFNKCEV